MGAPALAGLLPACGELPTNPRISVLLAVNEMLPGPHRFPLRFGGRRRRASHGREHQRAIRSPDRGTRRVPLRGSGPGAPRRRQLRPRARGRQGTHPQRHRAPTTWFPTSACEEGLWRADLEVEPAFGSAYAASTAFQVGRRTSAPRVGDSAPAFANLTSRGAPNLEALTTADPPLPALYEHSIVETLSRAEPFVVAFSTPGYCTSAMCGPCHRRSGQPFPRLRRPRALHPPRALRSTTSPAPRADSYGADAALEWNLETEPWVFVVDASGRVAARFEGLVGVVELEPAVAAVAGLAPELMRSVRPPAAGAGASHGGDIDTRPWRMAATSSTPAPPVLTRYAPSPTGPKAGSTTPVDLRNVSTRRAHSRRGGPRHGLRKRRQHRPIHRLRVGRRLRVCRARAPRKSTGTLFWTSPVALGPAKLSHSPLTWPPPTGSVPSVLVIGGFFAAVFAHTWTARRRARA